MPPPPVTSSAVSGCLFDLSATCLVVPPEPTAAIFGFAQFTSALALLVVLFNISDARYRFRLLVAPGPLHTVTYVLLGLIGVLTLAADIWFTERWRIPAFLNSRAVWQGSLAFIFLALAMTWILYAFILPPRFGRANAGRYAQQLYRSILSGTEADLVIILNELSRSARSLVRLSRARNQPSNKPWHASEHAFAVLLMIGNRKVAKHIVAATPSTAIAFFEAASEQKRYDVPLSQFAMSIATEALLNKNSAIFHEESIYTAGLFGYWQPFTKAVFGDYRLVEALGNMGSSPLDVDPRVLARLDGPQFEAYLRAFMVTIGDYIDVTGTRLHSFAVYRTLSSLEGDCHEVHQLDGLERDLSSSDKYLRVKAVIEFTKDLIALLNDKEVVPIKTDRAEWRRHGAGGGSGIDLHFQAARLIFELLTSASHVKQPASTSWHVQHNVIWVAFFGWNDSPAMRVVRRMVRRMIYETIKEFDTQGFVAANALAICLNVMGLDLVKRHAGVSNQSYYALHAAVLNWTKRNYLHLRNRWPALADACLTGTITFDEERNRLVKTYLGTFGQEPPQDFLTLDPASEPSAAEAPFK